VRAVDPLGQLRVLNLQPRFGGASFFSMGMISLCPSRFAYLVQATDSSQMVERGGEDRFDGSLYQGRSSGCLSATAIKPLTSAIAIIKKMTMTSSPRVIDFPAWCNHIMECAATCLFTSGHRNERWQRKKPAEAGLEGATKK
jgi:hypothetical protein